MKTVLHSAEFLYLWDRNHGYLQKTVSLPFRPKSPVKDLEDTDETFCKKFKEFKNSMFHFSKQYHKLKRERENLSGKIDVENLTELGLTDDQLPKGINLSLCPKPKITEKSVKIHCSTVCTYQEN